MTRERIIAAACLAVLAAVAAVFEFSGSSQPVPPPSGKFSLRGKFIGADAASDAAAFAGVCGAIADALELDGKATAPRIATGLQLEDLRIAISEFRFAPQPLRERQPHVRTAVGKYLDEAAGTSGGPLDEKAREKWVAAFRELSRASEEATR